MRSGLLDQRITFERKYITRDADFGTERVQWDAVATVWANLHEAHLGEAVANSERTAAREATVRSRWVPNVTSDMRIRDTENGRVYQIVSVVEARKRLWLDLVVREYSV